VRYASLTHRKNLSFKGAAQGRLWWLFAQKVIKSTKKV